MAAPRKPERSDPHYQLPSRRITLRASERNDCVVALKALAEDTRVNIVALLMKEALGVGDIALKLGVSQYNVSKHLRILREAGLLEVEKHGRKRLYALPATFKRRANAAEIMDLGCCSFQFNAPKRSSRN